MDCLKVGSLLLIAVFMLTEGYEYSEVKPQHTSKLLDILIQPFAKISKISEGLNNVFSSVESYRPHIPKKLVKFIKDFETNRPHIPEKITQFFQKIERNRPHIPKKILEIIENIDNSRPHIARKIIEFLLFIDKNRPHLFLRILKKIRLRLRHAIAKRPLLGKLLKLLDRIRYKGRGYVVKVMPRINTSYLEERKPEDYEEEGEPEEIGATNDTEITNSTDIVYVPYVETTTKGPIVIGKFFNRVMGDLFNVYYKLM
ncbi:hypothetical protein C0J52_05288 [Blattella germanica]|nr:hypothetical protein C0J52_05288 [Blattella germanica]